MTQRMPTTRAVLCRRIYNGLHGLVHACNIFVETVLDKAGVSGFMEQRPCWSVMFCHHAHKPKSESTLSEGPIHQSLRW